MIPVSNKTELQTTGEAVCSYCGAPLHGAANVCWLCFTPIAASAPKRAASSQTAELQTPRSASTVIGGNGYSLASLMMFVTLASVVLGVSTQWPGIGVPLGFVSFIIWLRTVNVVRHRVAQGHAVTSAQKLHIFLSSFAGTVAVLTLVCITGAAALGTVCAAIITVMDPNAIWYLLVAIVIAVGGLIALKQIFRYINSRAE